jgi:uncharacterized protein YbaR (Trm112 family)
MTSGRTPILDEETIAILRCPVTGGRLRFDADQSCLISDKGGLRYPVKDGIPVLLAEEAKLPAGFESLEAFRKQFGKPQV